MTKDIENNIQDIINSKNYSIKYNNETKLNYVCGNDISFKIYTIDENNNKIEITCQDETILEQDYNFMLDVLKFTRDKNMINFCSDELLDNPLFIYNIMDCLKEDRVFCLELANKFLYKNRHNYDINIINVALLAKEIDHGRYLDETDYVIKYLSKVYNKIKIEPERIINKTCDFKFNFSLVLENFSNNYLFLDFMASRMLIELYNKLIDENLEFYVKSKYKSPRYIESIGIVQYILNIIRAYDVDLACYVELHQGLIQNKIIELTNIIEEWKIEYCDIEDDIYEYILNYSEEHPEVDKDIYLKYIAKELNMNSLLEYTSESINESLKLAGFETIDFTNEYIYKVDDSYKEILIGNLKRELLVFINNYNLYNDNNKKVLKKTIIQFPGK